MHSRIRRCFNLARLNLIRIAKSNSSTWHFARVSSRCPFLCNIGYRWWVNERSCLCSSSNSYRHDSFFQVSWCLLHLKFVKISGWKFVKISCWNFVFKLLYIGVIWIVLTEIVVKSGNIFSFSYTLEGIVVLESQS